MPTLDHLDSIADRIRADWTKRNAARDATLARSRELIRLCATIIRASHRDDLDKAQRLLAEGAVAEGAMKDVKVHMIADDALMNDLSVSTKLLPNPVVLARLKEAGEDWEKVGIGKGEYLFKQDDHSDSVFILAKGLLQVSITEKDGSPYETGRQHGPAFGSEPPSQIQRLPMQILRFLETVLSL